MPPALEEKVRQITYRSEGRLEKVRALSLPEQSAIFEYLSPHVQQSLLTQLKNQEIVDILDHMDIRLAEILLARIADVKRRDKIIFKLKSGIKEKVEYFLRFHTKATMSLINFGYLLLPATATISATATAIDEHYQETGKFPEVLVHQSGVLMGEVLMSDLVRERNTQQLKKYVQPVMTITYLAEVSDVMSALSASKKKKVIVLDSDESVLGIIYADEALALFGNVIDESLYDVAGVDDSERPFDGALTKFQKRHRWLILNLVTCFLAGSVIYFFGDTVEKLVVLAMYIPIVAGMGGNAAAQTFAVMLRGITLGSISLKNCWPAIMREMAAGLLNGVVIGIIVALIGLLWNDNMMLGFVLGVTMVGQHVIAAFFGGVVPLFLKYFGKDPAATSTIFITTTTDVGGFALLLGLGTLFLM